LCLLKEIGNRHRSVGRCWLERLLLQSGDRSSVTGTTSAIDDYTKLQAQETGRTTDPLRPVLARVRANKLQLPLAENVGTDRNALAPTLAAAAIRQNSQLPAFAPLLEELEVAGWSSHRRTLSGNFHDWTLLEGRTLLVMAGQAVPSQADDAIDPIEAALVAQGAWASIRSHSHHATDAGTLMSLAARGLWSNLNSGLHAALIVAMFDLDGGHASVAVAGDCLALRIRAAGTEQIATNQPLLGADPNFNYVSHLLKLSLRERVLLVADEPLKRPAKLAARIAASFSRLDAEAHRRMIAADAIAPVRASFEQQAGNNRQVSASIVAVRRR
jgi:hypothetical protein